MVYRKTPAILAEIESRRAAIVSATEDIILKFGLAGLTIELVATQAGISPGLIYKHFPDKSELVPTMVGAALSRDLKMLYNATSAVPVPASLARGVAVIYYRMRGGLLNAALYASPIYRDGMAKALACHLPAGIAETPARAKIASAAILGATRGIWEATDGDRRGARHAAVAAFRIVGLTEAAAARMMERYSLT